MIKRCIIAFILLFLLNGFLRNYVLGDEWKDGNLLVNFFITIVLTLAYAGADFCICQIRKRKYQRK